MDLVTEVNGCHRKLVAARTLGRGLELVVEGRAGNRMQRWHRGVVLVVKTYVLNYRPYSQLARSEVAVKRTVGCSKMTWPALFRASLQIDPCKPSIAGSGSDRQYVRFGSRAVHAVSSLCLVPTKSLNSISYPPVKSTLRRNLWRGQLRRS